MAKNLINITAEGKSVEEVKSSLEEQVKRLAENMGGEGRITKEEYTVFYFTGDDHKKGSFSATGKNYDEAVKAAKENSPVEITDAYKEHIQASMEIKYTPKQVEEAKEKGRGTPAVRSKQSKVKLYC